MGVKKAAVSEILFYIFLLVISIAGGIILYDIFSTVKDNSSRQLEENSNFIEKNTNNNILLVSCGEDVRPLLNFLSRYGTVTLDSKVVEEDDARYNVIVLYGCDIYSFQDNLMKLSENVKIIGIGDVGDAFFRQVFFSVYKTTNLQYLTLNKVSRIIIPPSSLIKKNLEGDYIIPSNENIVFFKGAVCKGFELAQLDPYDPSNSIDDLSTAVCLSRNRLYFNYDINKALKEGQTKNLLTTVFDFFILKY